MKVHYHGKEKLSSGYPHANWVDSVSQNWNRQHCDSLIFALQFSYGVGIIVTITPDQKLKLLAKFEDDQNMGLIDSFLELGGTLADLKTFVEEKTQALSKELSDIKIPEVQEQKDYTSDFNTVLEKLNEPLNVTVTFEII